MRNKFDEQLHRLDEQLTHMGELCEAAIAKATDALKHGSIEEAKTVIAEDEEIDQCEKDIERLCLKLLLQQLPGGKGSKKNIRGAQDDHGYGAYRRSDGGYR